MSGAATGDSGEGSPGWREVARRPVVWIPAAAVALFTIAAIVFVATTSAGDATAAPTASPTPTSTPTPQDSSEPEDTPTPTPSPVATAELLDGFATVLQLPLEQVPWEEVGPGWFLVDSLDPEGPPNLGLGGDIGGDFQATPQLSGGVSLVAPDGKWYAVRTHDELGVGPVIAWDGTSAWLAREVSVDDGTFEVNSGLVNLRLGRQEEALSEGSADAPLRFGYLVVGDGAAVTMAPDGDDFVLEGTGPRAGATDGCSAVDVDYYGTEATDLSFLYSPTNGGQMVCFDRASNGRYTEMILLNVADPEQSTSLAEFSHPSSDSWVFMGWVDQEQFLMGRYTSGELVGMYRTSVSSDEVRSVDITFDASQDNLVAYFDRQSQRFIVHSLDDDDPSQWTIEVYGAVGDAGRTLRGSCTPPDSDRPYLDFRISGTRMLITCDASSTMMLVDLQTVSTIAEWNVGEGRSTVAFDFPGF